MDNGGVPEPAPSPAVEPARLQAYPCRQLCAWTRTRRRYPGGVDGLPVFSCAGCGSQWVRTEPWTPIDATGTVPAAVAREATRR